jgi:hypothetical protein
MKKFEPDHVVMLIIAIACTAIICITIYGISSLNNKLDPPFERNCYKWEYSSFYPLTATADELLQAEKTLKSNGYTRVVIRPKYRETWTDMERVGTEIFATRQLPELTNETGGEQHE